VLLESAVRRIVANIVAASIASAVIALPSASFAVSSSAHRADARGTYGGLKRNNLPPGQRRLPGSNSYDLKQPYYYRYYSDTDKSPGSCRRFARRAIITKNSNWWTRYRACLD
jgi:hypothetical protein